MAIKCPYCYRPLDTHTHDPILLPDGSKYKWISNTELEEESDITKRIYKGFYQVNEDDVIELQDELKSLEEENLPLIDRTEFSPLNSTGKFQITGYHIKEMRDSVEKILTNLALTKITYFNYDEDNNHIIHPNGDKIDWTDPIIDAADLQKFQVKNIHIEDLRHYIQILWRERWENAVLWNLSANYNGSNYPSVPPWVLSFGLYSLTNQNRIFFSDTSYAWFTSGNFYFGTANNLPNSVLNYNIDLNKKWTFNLLASVAIPVVIGSTIDCGLNYYIQQNILGYKLKSNLLNLHLKGLLTYTLGGSATIFHPAYGEPAGGYHSGIYIEVTFSGSKKITYYDRQTNDSLYYPITPTSTNKFIVKDLTNFNFDLYSDYVAQYGVPPGTIYWTGIKILLVNMCDVWGSFGGTNLASASLIASLDNLWINYE